MKQTMVTIDDRKNSIVEKLSTEYSLNHISLEEYERLIAYSHGIETDKELKILEKIIEETKSVELNYSEKTEPNNSLVKNCYSILSSRKSSGSVINETNGKFVSILGEHQIILNEDDLHKEVTELDVMVILGNIVIHVPENVNVISKAVPILAEVSVKDNILNNEGNKKLIIKGTVILGEIKIKIRRDKIIKKLEKIIDSVLS